MTLGEARAALQPLEEATRPSPVPTAVGPAVIRPAGEVDVGASSQDTFVLSWRMEPLPLAEGSCVYKVVGADFVSTEVVFFCSSERVALTLLKLVDDVGVKHTVIHRRTAA